MWILCRTGRGFASRSVGRFHSRASRLLVRGLVCGLLLTAPAVAASKIHVITFGKSTSAQWFAGGTDDKPATIKIRALVIDGRVKEYFIGPAHDVTDRLFVVRRMFRVNDSLPEDSAPRWQWQRGGWLLVDRLTARVSPINLPEFDAFYSAALKAGAADNGHPGIRPHYHPNYYGAFVIDPNGINLEAVCHTPE